MTIRDVCHGKLAQNGSHRAHGSSVGTGLGQSKRLSEDLLTQSRPSGKHKVRLANPHSRKAAEYAKISESRATSPARRAGCLARLLLLKDPTKREPDARCTITSRERSLHGQAPLPRSTPRPWPALRSHPGVGGRLRVRPPFCWCGRNP